MFGYQELLLVFLAIVLLFGASKLPELARSMGKSLGEFKRGQIEVERDLKTMKESAPEKEAELTKVQKMAKKLNIDITGKTEDQLLAEIETKLGEKGASSN
ncbi:twin-arginine translocase TatA/TatE family subunit [Methanocella sp. CWC-04]|uniref:Sec-independent protein translocase protein TatA n=2 Tax=Methanooceanicella nereidis TaxID=2052831 RepID=A0AAP2RC82_9EURY|nr:twin-arginine translocase TatA/TatE family subunit [Methanocella sp. CWC-04]